MSRIGRQPIQIPTGVTVTVEPGRVDVAGPRGTLSQAVSPDLSVDVADGRVVVSRPTDQKEHRSLHGLTRSLVANMVTGVDEGFQKTLELVGVGYRAQESADGIVLQVGFSHPVPIHPLEGVTLSLEGNNRIHVQGIDKQRVGEVAARIRKVRPPNVYTGKGVRYLNEQVRRKPGKSAGRSR
jgi:large subunit ribosomal protein L6